MAAEQIKIERPFKGWKKLTAQDKKKYFNIMRNVNKFCNEHDISAKNFTYYLFEIKDKKYMVTSDAFLYRCFGQNIGTTEAKEFKIDKVIYASKFRIVEIYKNLLLGKQLDERGRVVKNSIEKGLEV